MRFRGARLTERALTRFERTGRLWPRHSWCYSTDGFEKPPEELTRAQEEVLPDISPTLTKQNFMDFLKSKEESGERKNTPAQGTRAGDAVSIASAFSFDCEFENDDTEGEQVGLSGSTVSGGTTKAVELDTTQAFTELHKPDRRQIENSFQATTLQQNRRKALKQFDQFLTANILSGMKRPDKPAYSPPGSKFARVCILGTPNVGKSVLMNRLIAHPVSAVSRKAHTTKIRVTGCLTVENVQLEFFDTPGILPHRRERNLQPETHDLTKHAWDAAYEADICVVVVDGSRAVQSRERRIVEQLEEIEFVSKVLVINKSDLVWPKKKMQVLAHELNNMCKFDIVFFASAQRNLRINRLKGYLLACAPKGMWLNDPGLKTFHTYEQQVAEIVREKIFHRTHRELPHILLLTIDRIETDKSVGALWLEVTIYCERKSQQVILTSSAKKHLRRWSERDLETYFKVPVKLDLRVKLGIPDERDCSRFENLKADELILKLHQEIHEGTVEQEV